MVPIELNVNAAQSGHAHPKNLAAVLPPEKVSPKLPSLEPPSVVCCDYLLVVSTGMSEPLPAAESRLGRRTALTFPLLPPPQKN